jgi:hypothetical protein
VGPLEVAFPQRRSHSMETMEKLFNKRVGLHDALRTNLVSVVAVSSSDDLGAHAVYKRVQGEIED